MPQKPKYEELEKRVQELEQAEQERERAEEALTKSEETLRAMFDASPMAIVLIDRNGIILDSNGEHANRLKTTREEILGQCLWNLLPKDVREHRKTQVESVFETGIPFSGEDKRGTIWNEYHIHPAVKNGKNEIEAVIVEALDITERKRAELALRHEEEKFRTLIENIVDWVWVVDTRGRYTYVSPQAKEIIGYDTDEILGKTPFDFMSSEEAQRVAPIFSEALERRQRIFALQDTMLAKDGSEVIFETNSTPLFSQQGGMIGYMGTCRDITERKEAEEALRKSKGRFERMLNVIPDFISIHDPEMNILYSNWKGFGTVPEERRRLYTKCYNTYRGFDIICPDCRAKEVMDSGQSLQEEVELPDGTWVDLRVIPIMDNEGNIEMFMEWVRDITPHKQFQLELQSQKRLLEGVLDSIKDVIGVQLPDHTVIQYNRAGYELLGLTAAEIKGKKCYELIGRSGPCEMCATAECYLSKTIETIEKFVPELGRHFLCTSNPVLDEKGNVKLIIEQLTDITDQKKAEERLRQARKLEMIGSLAGGIAHDFNNILFPIVGLSEILLEDLPAGSPERENAAEIFQAGKRGSALVKQILAFSRQSDRKMVPTRVQHILKEVLKLSRSTVPTYIDIQQQIQPDCGMIMADPTQIHQVAMNLITNAYHAMEDEGGKLTVRLKEVALLEADYAEASLEPGKYALLSISDTGHGISNEFIHKIFEPYFTTKEQGKGTGLGLSVVYGIVKENKGDIKVHSEMGKGSTFDIYFPLLDKAKRSESGKEVEDDMGGNERILLVDDEDSIAKLEKQMLERLGYKVTIRFSSLDALEAFKINPDLFDLVISDMSMPSMPGDRLARELIAIRPDIPVIICTGFSDRMNPDQANAMGIKGFIMKPVVKTDMAKLVRKVLDAPARSS